jgi:hypothetical protein
MRNRIPVLTMIVAALSITAALSAPVPSWGQSRAVPPQPGYWLLGGDGGIFAFHAPFAGSGASDPTRCPPNTTDRSRPDGTCFSLAATPDGGGYWILNGDTNAVYPYGDAVSYGQPADGLAGVSREFVPTGVSMAATPSGHGYWVLELPLSGAGKVLAFGDATFFGDTTGIAANGSPVGMARTPDGGGYWIVFSDGGVFAYGDAAFHGSMGGVRLNQPVTGMAATPDGGGYWLVASDGGVFAFGDAVFAGSMARSALRAPMVAMAANPDGGGYWTVAADGGVFAFGGAPFLGSMGAAHLNRPVVGLATRG